MSKCLKNYTRDICLKYAHSSTDLTGEVFFSHIKSLSIDLLYTIWCWSHK